MLGIIVAQALRKKRKITITTSATVNSSVNSISLTDARMVVVRSKSVLSVTEGGIEARNSGSSALMRSTVSIMLAPGCRPMPITTAGLPFAYPELRRSSIPSVTFAMSLSRTGAPFLIGHNQGRVLLGLQELVGVIQDPPVGCDLPDSPWECSRWPTASAARTSSRLIP